MFNASKNSNDSEDKDEDELLVHMPDTSILFQQYLKSRRMINIYDWFESFAVVLKAQKQHKKPSRKPSCNGNSSVPRTPCMPQMPLCYDHSNKKQQQNVDGDEEGEAPQNEERKKAEEELESWRLEAGGPGSVHPCITQTQLRQVRQAHWKKAGSCAMHCT